MIEVPCRVIKSLVVPVGTRKGYPEKDSAWVGGMIRGPVPPTAFKRSSVITNCAASFFLLISFHVLLYASIRLTEYGVWK
jgi:hypothetical protein